MKSNRLIKRLDWYIIKKFLGTYVFAIALIISIAVVFDFNEKMDKLMEHEAPWDKIIFEYYMNSVSYTHLDVYKRQPISPSKDNLRSSIGLKVGIASLE